MQEDSRRIIHRDTKLHVRVSREERARWAASAAIAGMTLSAFVRARLDGHRPVAKAPASDVATLKALSLMLNNLNQLTRLAHMNAITPADSVLPALEELSAFATRVGEALLESLS